MSDECICRGSQDTCGSMTQFQKALRLSIGALWDES